jgi:hypothetical protein
VTPTRYRLIMAHLTGFTPVELRSKEPVVPTDQEIKDFVILASKCGMQASLSGGPNGLRYTRLVGEALARLKNPTPAVSVTRVQIQDGKMALVPDSSAAENQPKEVIVPTVLEIVKGRTLSKAERDSLPPDKLRTYLRRSAEARKASEVAAKS